MNLNTHKSDIAYIYRLYQLSGEKKKSENLLASRQNSEL